MYDIGLNGKMSNQVIFIFLDESFSENYFLLSFTHPHVSLQTRMLLFFLWNIIETFLKNPDTCLELISHGHLKLSMYEKDLCEDSRFVQWKKENLMGFGMMRASE